MPINPLDNSISVTQVRDGIEASKFYFGQMLRAVSSNEESARLLLRDMAKKVDEERSK